MNTQNVSKIDVREDEKSSLKEENKSVINKSVVRNVVDVYHHIDGMDMPMEVITYFDEASSDFDIIEVVDGTVQKFEADENIKKLFEQKKAEVEKRDRILSRKFSRIVSDRVCVFCGSKLYSIRNENYSRYLRLNRDREGYYCRVCKTTYVHNKYPSPCHFSESVEAIRNHKVVYSISFDYYRSPLIPRFREYKGE